MVGEDRSRSWRQRTASAAAGLQAGVSALTFLVVHGVLHLLHVAGVDPPVIARLIPIPLFSQATIAAVVALGAAIAGWPLVRGGRVRPRWLAAAFVVAPGVFAISVVLFP